jgi:CheY-like chemotaxis protein
MWTEMDDFMTPILIVDDDPDIRVLLRSILKSSGFHCDEAWNGLEALEKIETHAYALILLDYSMPLMNGLEVIQRLAQKSWNSRPKIIMMTAHTDETIRNQAIEAGAKAVLSKPFDIDEVISTINKALKNGHHSLPCTHSSP